MGRSRLTSQVCGSSAGGDAVSNRAHVVASISASLSETSAAGATTGASNIRRSYAIETSPVSGGGDSGSSGSCSALSRAPLVAVTVPSPKTIGDLVSATSTTRSPGLSSAISVSTRQSWLYSRSASYRSAATTTDQYRIRLSHHGPARQT